MCCVPTSLPPTSLPPTRWWARTDESTGGTEWGWGGEEGLGPYSDKSSVTYTSGQTLYYWKLCQYFCVKLMMNVKTYECFRGVYFFL